MIPTARQPSDAAATGMVLPFRRSDKLDPMTPSDPAAMPRARNDAADDSRVWGEWMLRAQEGDRNAYQHLLLAITPYLRAIARRYLGRGEDAEDAVQEILIVVHDIRHTYEHGRAFKPWLNTIASRRCIDLLRRRSRRRRYEVADDAELGEQRDGGAGPEESARLLQEAMEVRDAIGALSPRQREAVRLLRLQELSLGEAAEISQQSIGSLKVACHRALKSLKHALAHKGRKHD